MSAEGGIPFGSYALLKRLARGGMAEVFLAKQRYLDGYDRRVAVKRILPHLSDSGDFVRMFLGEARLAARLTHPNIVHIYDFGKVGDEYYIAMEYVDGVHCGQLIKHAASEPLPPTLIARIGADAAAALHYAHGFADADGTPLRLVHRDVSPPNLMVSFDGVVKLVDFGIAKAASIEQKTNPGTVKGKYAYMSPEQTTARPLDGRSDVFSLGLVLWELIAGRHIVERGNPVDAMRAIRDGKLPSIRAAVPGVPRELAHALDLALETDREDRTSALELSQVLEAYIKAAPELATPVQLATWIRGRFQPATTGAALALPAGPGTRVATAASSAAQSVVTPDGRDRTEVARGAIVEDSDLRDTIIDGATVRREIGRPPIPAVARARGGTRPPPIPAASRRATGPPPHAGGAADDDAGDLDDNETIARGPTARATPSPIAGPSVVLMRPEDRPTDLGPVARPTIVADAAAVGAETVIPGRDAPGAHVASGTQTRTPALPAADPTRPEPRRAGADRFATPPEARAGLVDRTAERLRRASPRRRAALAAIAGGVFAAMFVIGYLLLRRDRAPVAAPPDAAVAAPPPIDAAPVVTQLRVVTTPSGAVAALGDRRGQTPITFEVAPGRFALHVELAGHVAVDRTVELALGEHRVLELTLDEVPPPPPATDAAPARPPERDHPTGHDRPTKKGALTITTTPYSDVYLGKRYLGQTPFADVAVAAGQLTLTFKHPGRRTITRSVQVKPGETTKLKFALP